MKRGLYVTDDPVKKLVFSSMMAALTCVFTMVIHIPSPTNGFVNLGDGMVILCGILLGPYYGGAAAGIGSALADLLLSYPHYIPGTFLIKGGAAGLVSFIYHAASKKSAGAGKVKESLPVIFSGLGSLVVVVVGYFLYASIFLGKGVAAISSIPGNIVQGIFGLIMALILMPLLKRVL
ncbi:MAG: ECF transporter S component [Lachnospiraceae bacterium]|nr:ECF transporter S component [Lachnospiraceae bacterium]